MIDQAHNLVLRARTRASSVARPRSWRKTLTWLLFGAGLKLAVTALIFAFVADRAQADASSRLSPVQAATPSWDGNGA